MVTRRARHSLRARIRYSFDAALSRGPSVVIVWLVLLTLAIIVVAAVILAITRLSGINGQGRLGFADALWESMLRVIDPGTFASDEGWLTRILALVVTLAGIFMAGSLIGLIANAVNLRIEMLTKGRSAVLEDDHTLILGWSDRVPAIVSELIIANESRKRAAVVILADVDKTIMEELVRDPIDNFRTTRLVCRRGVTSSFGDLSMVNAAGARSIIVIGGNDASVAKTLLALRRGGDGEMIAPVVAEVGDAGTARSIRALFGDHIVIVNSDAIVAELTAQACRQRGLSQVFHELLDFDGDEIYFAPFAELTGLSYRDAQLSFETSCLLGILTPEGCVVLNPDPDTVIGTGDELIGIASDDSEFDACTTLRPASRLNVPVVAEEPEPQPRRMVLVGWSTLGPRVIAELDEFMGPETTLEILVDPGLHDADEVRQLAVAHNLRVDVCAAGGRPEDIAHSTAGQAFDEVIVLGRRAGITPEEADARTLLTLLAFERFVRDERLENVRIVAELLEQRHAPLAERTGADDFIVSDELTSLMIAQVSERVELEQVFRDLFGRAGSTIEMVRVERYGATQASCFAEVVVAASELSESALGYRSHRDGVIVLNPPKSEALQLHHGDSVVVLRSYTSGTGATPQ